MIHVIIVLDINDCSSHPCLNGGICVDEIQQFTCNCASGFTGRNCENGSEMFVILKLDNITFFQIDSKYLTITPSPTATHEH